MTDRVLESYESVPYDSKPIHLSHVSRIETAARLHGLTPAPSSRCRVLELGCASGGNLIPMAAGLPDSRFVGVDLAPSQIAAGEADVRALGLDNIALRAMSIADLTKESGEFDYIICHGLYSWVAPELQDAILRICADNLAPNGVAYVSYNVYPGWHLRSVARDLLVHQDDPSLPARERIARARALIETLANRVAKPTSTYEAVLADELVSLRRETDSYLLHEELAPFNNPVHFSEFNRRAASRGLRYVTDARLESNGERPAWSTALPHHDATDVALSQESLDFARGGTFRRSLLCRDSATPCASPQPRAVRDLYIATRSAPATPSDEDLRRSEGTAESFRSHDGAVITTNNPVLIGALRVLLQVAPGTLSYAELARRVAERVRMVSPPGFAVDDTNVVAGLDAMMLQCALGGMVELLSNDVALTPVVSERPMVSPIARLKAGQGGAVPNLRHFPVAVSGLDRLILLHLDGTRTRDDLLDIARRAITEGQSADAGGPPDGPDLTAAIDATLQRFANTAFLLA